MDRGRLVERWRYGAEKDIREGMIARTYGTAESVP
jgi:hypothetical protein